MRPLVRLLGAGLSRNALGTVVLRGGFCALELACGLAIARLFGASRYGTYALVAAWIALLGIPAAAGFDRFVVREVATYRDRGEWPLLRGLIERSGAIVLIVSITVALIVLLTTMLLSLGMTSDSRLALQIGTIAIPLLAFIRLRQGTVQGLGHVAAGQMPEMLVQPLALLALTSVLVIVPGIERSEPMAVALYVVSIGLACCAVALIMHRFMPSSARTAVPEYRTRAWLASSGPFLGMLALNVLTTKGDTVLVGMLAGSTPAGLYRLVNQLAMLVAFPLTCVNMAVAPTFATLFARGDQRGLQEIATSAARLVLLLSAPIAIGLVAFGPWILQLFGPEFVAGQRPLVILTVGYLVHAVSGTAGYLLIMTRYETRAMVVFGISSTLNVIGNLILIPIAGVEGAAIATALSLVGVSIAFAMLAKRELGIQPTALPTRRASTRS